MPRPTQSRHGILRARPDERGATLVEMALVLGIFLAFVFAIIEFSYATSQNAEVRHVAEEGARAAAVGNDAAAAICDNAVVTNGISYTFHEEETFPNRGSTGEVTVSANFQSLTGLLDGLTFTSTHRFYAEPDNAIPPSGAC